MKGRSILLMLALSLVIIVNAQERQVVQYQYWIDPNSSFETTDSIQNVENDTVSFTIDTNELSEGAHTLYFRVQDNEAQWSGLSSWGFFVRKLPQNIESEIISCEYWVGSDYGNREDIAVEGNDIAFSIDMSSQREGLHTLNYRLKDNNGMYSPLQTWMFLKEELHDTAIVNRVVSVDYWLDNRYTQGQSVAVDSSNVMFTIDTHAMSEGLHTLNYRLKDNNGMYSPLQTWMFMKSALRDTTIINRVNSVEYWFDNDTTNMQRIDVNSDTIIFAADASMLVEGAHIMSLRVGDVLGTKSAPANWMFYKDSAVESSKITWYKYWWEGHYDKAETVMVECDSSEFVLSCQLDIPDYVKTAATSDFASSRLIFMFGNGMGYSSVADSTNVTFQVSRYVVTYLVDGEVYITESVVCNDSIVPLAAPIKENRLFSGWKGLPEIMPEYDVTVEGAFKYQVDYIVGDTVLWHIGYFYGDTIFDSPEPEKEWCEFEEWVDLPESMPARDISVTAKFFLLLELGDVNGDDRISVSDITVLTNHIMQLPNTTFIRDAADLNGDGRISVVDVTMTTNKILSDEE